MFDLCGGRLVRVCRHCFFHITELLATLSVIYNVTLIVLLRMRCAHASLRGVGFSV